MVALTAAANSHLCAQSKQLVIERPARTWEAIDAVGRSSAWLGKENGSFEAWVYPLKIVRNFHLLFHAEDHVFDGATLVRTVIARPESTTIIYAADTFTVRETLIAPYKKSGLVVLLDVHTTAPMEIEARFERDFQLAWPAVIADPAVDWLPRANAFVFGSEKPEHSAIFGAPGARSSGAEYATNYSSNRESGFRLGIVGPGNAHQVIALAASVHGAKEAEEIYKELLANADSYAVESAREHEKYLSQTVELELPDKDLEAAYDWARVSILQSEVENPLMPAGVVAGYRYAADDRRPGYDWFFGRDTLWSILGTDAIGDPEFARIGLSFLGHYQRADGKIPHEVPQSTALIAPLETNPYSFASADSTLLYLIAYSDYLRTTNDRAFVEAHAAEIEKALSYTRSILDEQGLAKNEGAGTGWVEGGPLFPMHAEIYQASLGVEALKAMSHIDAVFGRNARSAELAQAADAAQKKLDALYWVSASKRYAYGIDLKRQQVDVPSVLATVPLWFGQLPVERASSMLDELQKPEQQADWGMRILSNKDARYNPGGYHWGSVWPLFTGYASVAEYRAHHEFAASENLRANALLTWSGTPGRVTEVLSGEQMQELETTTTHQTWSSAMVIEPLLLGMLGLETNAETRVLKVAPHLPAEWPHVGVKRVHVGAATVDFAIEQNAGAWSFEVAANNAAGVELELSPAFSLHARVVGAELDGRKWTWKSESNALDQHIALKFPLTGKKQRVVIRTVGNVRLSYEEALPALGEVSRGLRLVHEEWSADGAHVGYVFRGKPGAEYIVRVIGANEVVKVVGAELTDGKLRVKIPASGEGSAQVALSLKEKGAGR